MFSEGYGFAMPGEVEMTTLIGPFDGATVHDAIAEAMLHVGIEDVAASVRAMSEDDDAWLVIGSGITGGGFRAVLLRSACGWLVAIASDGECDDHLLAVTHYAAQRPHLLNDVKRLAR